MTGIVGTRSIPYLVYVDSWINYVELNSLGKTITEFCIVLDFHFV